MSNKGREVRMRNFSVKQSPRSTPKQLLKKIRGEKNASLELNGPHKVQ